MGWEPDEEEIPMEIDNLSYEAQMALALFHILPDKIEGMAGMWLGKDYSGLGDIMKIYGIEGDSSIFNLLQVCIFEYSKYYEQQRKIQEAKVKR